MNFSLFALVKGTVKKILKAEILPVSALKFTIPRLVPRQIRDKSFGDMTRSLNSVSIDGRSEKCPDKQNSTFDPEMLKLRQNAAIFFISGYGECYKKNKKYELIGELHDLFQ